MDEGQDTAAHVVDLLRARGWRLAVAESLTGGSVCEDLVRVPGVSEVLRGGVVAYAADLKATLLGVDPALLAERGPVDADVARQMAEGARARLGAEVGASTTGVAGPGPADGLAAGTVLVAVTGPEGTVVHRPPSGRFVGDRAAVRVQARGLCLDALVDYLVRGPHRG